MLVFGLGSPVPDDQTGISQALDAAHNNNSIATRAPYASKSGLKFDSRLNSLWIRLGGAFSYFCRGISYEN